MMCPYEENLGCPYVDTAFMDKTTTCRECEHYHKSDEGDGTEDVANFLLMEDWNNFMMGL